MQVESGKKCYGNVDEVVNTIVDLLSKQHNEVSLEQLDKTQQQALQALEEVKKMNQELKDVSPSASASSEEEDEQNQNQNGNGNDIAERPPVPLEGEKAKLQGTLADLDSENRSLSEQLIEIEEKVKDEQRMNDELTSFVTAQQEACKNRTHYNVKGIMQDFLGVSDENDGDASVKQHVLEHQGKESQESPESPESPGKEKKEEHEGEEEMEGCTKHVSSEYHEKRRQLETYEKGQKKMETEISESKKRIRQLEGEVEDLESVENTYSKPPRTQKRKMGTCPSIGVHINAANSRKIMATMQVAAQDQASPKVLLGELDRLNSDFQYSREALEEATAEKRALDIATRNAEATLDSITSQLNILSSKNGGECTRKVSINNHLNRCTSTTSSVGPCYSLQENAMIASGAS